MLFRRTIELIDGQINALPTFALSISTPLRPNGRREAWSGGTPKNSQLAGNIRTLTRVSVLEALVRDD
jgi:hypothetical protein